MAQGYFKIKAAKERKDGEQKSTPLLQMINTPPQNTNGNCAHCSQLQQAILTFTGLLKNHSDPEIKKAINRLYKNVNSVKIKSNN